MILNRNEAGSRDDFDMVEMETVPNQYLGRKLFSHTRLKIHAEIGTR